MPSSDSEAVELRLRVGLDAAQHIDVLSAVFAGPASPGTPLSPVYGSTTRQLGFVGAEPLLAGSISGPIVHLLSVASG